MGSSNNGEKTLLGRRSGRWREVFVFAVCGDSHAERVNASLRFLKKFSRKEIIVIVCSSVVPINHDQVIIAPVGPELDSHRASILLKTDLLKHLPDSHHRYCYLDSDVVAVSRSVDDIFNHWRPPVCFSLDHVYLDEFSRFAVGCGCRRACNHLRLAIRSKFGVNVADGVWHHWNGGVFVFDHESTEFMQNWHQFTAAALDDPYWKTRDQGTLAATTWKLGLQDHHTLPVRFNRIVDPFIGIPSEQRQQAPLGSLHVDTSYRLDHGKARPVLLHFINNGFGRVGWKNWDDAERLLSEDRPVPSETTDAMISNTPLSPDNLVVHGMWIGPRLSRLGLLTIQSFLMHGHEFHLWLYDDLETPLPRGVVLEDADRILRRSSIFRKCAIDKESGVGRGSYGTFSDLFRYKLLYERGGYWVDMDVTCLRPFNFAEEYLFRSHRVGVVGNIMKCPRHSQVMASTYEQACREANEHSSWLMTNRLLSQNVKNHGLLRYVRDDVCNPDSWSDYIEPMIEGDAEPAASWHAIHWINEYWRTIEADGGYYRGKKVYETIPDKDRPKENTTLARLYVEYNIPEIGLPEPSLTHTEQFPELSPSVVSFSTIEFTAPAPRQPIVPDIQSRFHINALLPSLAVGGAERSVLETISGLPPRIASAKLFVLHDHFPSYRVDLGTSVSCHRLSALDGMSRIQKIALEVIASPLPVLFTHLIGVKTLRLLWRWNIVTVPVIHNSRPSWQDSPEVFDHPNVPFVVAVSNAVAVQLKEARCPRPIVTLRHELQRWFDKTKMAKDRQTIRDRLGIGEDTVLIGMVGEFKSQKAYTRAVRVLASLRRYIPAKLMILGGWDHDWGNGRASYIATNRLALELGVIADLITPGPTPDVDGYLAAFDVFLNTSVYEGLSIATLEAVRAGCPIVTADAGGNRESIPDDAYVVKESWDIADYVRGIEKVLHRKSRPLASKPGDADLVPRIWYLLGQYAALGDADAARRVGTLFFTDNLNVGGAARSLINLLTHLPAEVVTWLGILNPVFCEGYYNTIQAAGVRNFSLHDSGSYLDKIERCLAMIEKLAVRNVCFWNVDPRVKLMLAKILRPGTVRLIDVSPGPWLFEDLDRHAAFQRRISYSARDYTDRLDHFVAKYAGGAPLGPARTGQVVIIPNGVPAPIEGRSPEAVAEFPPEFHPDLAIGTCCRILKDRHIEYLITMMEHLGRRLPGVSLTIVGGVDSRHSGYWQGIRRRLEEGKVANIFFAGLHADVLPYLRKFRVFVLAGEGHGCPNASLEAMMQKLPVVASSEGGTAEQVESGVNGFLVSHLDPLEMAHRVRYILTNPDVRRSFGEESRRIAAERFSMELMVKRYVSILEPDHFPEVPVSGQRLLQPGMTAATNGKF